MRKPWDITGDDIAEWARRYDASAVLPQLVRRLLAATTQLDRLEMAADAGVRAGGWDGIVEARAGHERCPPGLSVWELSVQATAKTKLDKDFEKRAAAPPGLIPPKLAVYVAVIAQRLQKGKDRWLKEKRALGIFRDVLLLDADDLAAWIEVAPAVGRWFAGKLGKPSADMTDLEAFLDGWSRRTSPPLPWELALSGEDRQEKAKQLVTWLTYPPGRPLYVRAASREEAMLFAAAAMVKGPQADRWLSRALVVESEESWRWALSAQRAEPLIVLPAFEGADPGKAAEKAYAILALDKSAPGVPGATLDLDMLPHRPLTKRLMGAGRSEGDAERLVERSGGSLAAMQRLLGYVELPGWAKHAPRAELLALLLAGAWVPQNELDREAIRKLGGDPESLDRLCTELEANGEVVREKEMWSSPVLRWRSREDAWKMLARGITELSIERFAKVVLEVLGTPPKTVTMEERVEAVRQSKALSYSGALWSGLAESIARLAVHGEIFKDTRGASLGTATAGNLVRRLLDAEGAWQPWAYLSSALPVLAEAAPEVFLDVLERSLDRGDEGVSHLLALESKSALGGAPHTGLLWALETLGWYPEVRVVRRVALAFARLAARDPGGRFGNRPINSLSHLLHPMKPQSNTSVADRLTMLDMIFSANLERDIGWQVALGWVQAMLIVSAAHKPEIRSEEWHYRADCDASASDVGKQYEGVVSRLLERAGADPQKWSELVEHAKHLGHAEARVLDTLEASQSGIVDPDALVWAALRERIYWAPRADDGVDAKRQERLRILYAKFQPGDIVPQVEWLFAPRLTLPERRQEDWEADARDIEGRRQAALSMLWESGAEPWSLLARLVASRSVEEAPGTLGVALATSLFADELEARLFDGAGDQAFARILPSFGAARAAAKGMAWLDAVLRRLLERDRLVDAIGVLLHSTATGSLWDCIDAIGGRLREEYWKRIGHIIGLSSGVEVERAVSNLLDVGNDFASLQVASWSRAPVGGEVALRVLDAVAKQVRGARSEDDARRIGSAIVSDDIQRLFEIVDDDTTLDRSHVLAMEMVFLPWLAESNRSTKLLAQALADPADGPRIFLQLLSFMYPRKGESASPHAQAAFAKHILEIWRGFPGEDLDGDAREEKLRQWSTAVLERAHTEGLGDLALSRVAEVLSRVPEGSDGVWPCIAARRLIESGKYESFAASLRLAKWNARGWTSRSPTEGGVQERDIADTHRAAAEKIQAEYPRTAAMLDAFARTYEAEAEQHDASAKQERIRYGEDDPDTHPPPTPVPPSEPPGLLTRVEIHHVGPARDMAIDLAPRLNLFLGDNSAGKTFALEILWWALTGTWTSRLARPRPLTNGKKPRSAAEGPSIVVVAGERRGQSAYDPEHDTWSRPFRAPPARGLTVYARVDGGFSIWDPVRNEKPKDASELDLSDGYHFSYDDIWKGKRAPDGISSICHGILEDAVLWRSEQRGAFALLEKALTSLSPPGEPIEFGLPKRFAKNDDKKHPTILMPWGPVFAVHASAAIKRVLGLAYALVWGFTNYIEAAKIAKREAIPRVTMLIDELEAHLHPKWQRYILLSLLDVADMLGAEVQLVVSTHAPLIVSSVEPRVTAEKDALFQFRMPAQRADKREAEVERVA